MRHLRKLGFPILVATLKYDSVLIFERSLSFTLSLYHSLALNRRASCNGDSSCDTILDAFGYETL